MDNKILMAILFGALILSCGNSTETNNNTQQQNTQQQVTKIDEGKDLYLKYCMACHQTDGSGVPGMYPPVRNSDWVTGDKKRLINIVLNGLEGEIEVNGQIYSQMMPKQDYLTDKQIAQILTYLRKNFGNNADSVKVNEVKNLRNKK